MIKRVVLIAAVSAFSAFGASWTGQISDSACGMSHAKMMASDKSLKTDRDCALACIKAGAKYVFVSDGKVYQLANQNFAALKTEAGENVELTGTMKGDTITVSKVTKK